MNDTEKVAETIIFLLFHFIQKGKQHTDESRAELLAIERSAFVRIKL